MIVWTVWKRKKDRKRERKTIEGRTFMNKVINEPKVDVNRKREYKGSEELWDGGVTQRPAGGVPDCVSRLPDQDPTGRW